ncbi:hypothetical protein CN996_22895 [Bacillus cereus]|nr:hypothetical protein COK21_09935 [Bacillus cereus]PGO98727.1 hypothetical protein CN996_22895 [Bacillus cereus]
MITIKLYEVLMGYENGKFKDGDEFLYQNNPRMKAMFEYGDLVWCDEHIAVSCKSLSRDLWTHKERVKIPTQDFLL